MEKDGEFVEVEEAADLASQLCHTDASIRVDGYEMVSYLVNSNPANTKMLMNEAPPNILKILVDHINDPDVTAQTALLKTLYNVMFIDLHTTSEITSLLVEKYHVPTSLFDIHRKLTACTSEAIDDLLIVVYNCFTLLWGNMGNPAALIQDYASLMSCLVSHCKSCLASKHMTTALPLFTSILQFLLVFTDQPTEVVVKSLAKGVLPLLGDFLSSNSAPDILLGVLAASILFNCHQLPFIAFLPILNGALATRPGSPANPRVLKAQQTALEMLTNAATPQNAQAIATSGTVALVVQLATLRVTDDEEGDPLAHRQLRALSCLNNLLISVDMSVTKVTADSLWTKLLYMFERAVKEANEFGGDAVELLDGVMSCMNATYAVSGGSAQMPPQCSQAIATLVVNRVSETCALNGIALLAAVAALNPVYLQNVCETLLVVANSPEGTIDSAAALEELISLFAEDEMDAAFRSGGVGGKLEASLSLNQSKLASPTTSKMDTESREALQMALENLKGFLDFKRTQ